MTSTRKLVAILFTDIVGYTAMMRGNESSAVASVRRFANVLQELVDKHEGQVLNNYGDGSLCSFSSVEQALLCARELQRSMQELPVIPLRIGVHLGEIYLEDNKAFGDSVNVASRLTALGKANSILVSKDVFEAIRNRPEFPVKSLGAFRFKHINEPVTVFALALDGLSIPSSFPDAKLRTGSSRLVWFGAGAILLVILSIVIYLKILSKPAIPKVAVLPFYNESPGEGIGWVSVGIPEEMIRSLSNKRGLAVVPMASTYQFRDRQQSISEIANKLPADYYVNGTVRKQGDDYAIYVELIRWSDQTSVFAMPYLKKANELLLFKAELANRLANELVNEEGADLLENPEDETSNTKALEYYLKGVEANREAFASNDDKYILIAENYCLEALREDPKYVAAICLLADIYDTRLLPYDKSTWRNGITRDSLASVANRLSPNSKLSLLTMYISFLKRESPDIDSAFIFIKNAYERYPNDAEVLRGLGMFYVHIGMADEGNQLLEKAIRIDALFMPARRISAFYYYYTGDLKSAEQRFVQILKLNPTHFDSLSLARIYLRSGNLTAYRLMNESWRNNDTTSYRVNRGLLFAAQGKKEEALKLVPPAPFVASLLGISDSLVNHLRRNKDRPVATFRTVNENINFSLPALERGPFWKKVRNNEEFLKMKEDVKKAYEFNRKKYLLQIND